MNWISCFNMSLLFLLALTFCSLQQGKLFIKRQTKDWGKYGDYSYHEDFFIYSRDLFCRANWAFNQLYHLLQTNNTLLLLNELNRKLWQIVWLWIDISVDLHLKGIKYFASGERLKIKLWNQVCCKYVNTLVGWKNWRIFYFVFWWEAGAGRAGRDYLLLIDPCLCLIWKLCLVWVVQTCFRCWPHSDTCYHHLTQLCRASPQRMEQVSIFDSTHFTSQESTNNLKYVHKYKHEHLNIQDAETKYHS